MLPWSSLLTVYRAERNLNPQGKPRIDLNDDDLRRLHQRLGQVFDRQWAEFDALIGALGAGPPLRLALLERSELIDLGLRIRHGVSYTPFPMA